MEKLADDPSFIDAIVHEVKSQGLFDQFRKECLADVDTKPAYQNLRQRVETSVGKFLSQQNWTDNIRHKNQLREKLRKNIIDSGFLETGVERIVDQVVNPKISTVFHPKVEEIVYNYLGIEKPKPTINGTGLDVQTNFLPEDLEAVSPDSDKKSSSTSSDMQITMEQPTIEPELNESKEIVDDFESPAFEPLQVRPPSQTKQESSDSNNTAISGLTSQESVDDDNPIPVVNEAVTPHSAENVSSITTGPEASNLDGEATVATTSPEVGATDSQLSQVSSNSRLSIITNSEGNLHQPESVPNLRLDITEEAQMPKFNDNSNGEEGEIMDSDDSEAGDQQLEPQKSNFDLHKESYEFKGTERNSRIVENEKEEPVENETVLVQESNADNCEIDDEKDKNLSLSSEQPKQSPLGSNKSDDDSSQSERSLRICEDSTMEPKVMDTGSQLDNCDSAKTPLNDEYSTESAPDVEKMDGSQVEVVTLAAVQQHADGEKVSDRRHVSRSHHHNNRHERKHASSSSQRHRTGSSSRDRRSHSSSKHGSSTSGSGSRKSDHRDRKSENGNSHSNGGHSKRNYDKKKVSDDHYSSHDKSSKKRRSTDRDSNDGAGNGKPAETGNESCIYGGSTGNNESAKQSPESQRRSGGSREKTSKLNDSIESSFEGFEEEQMVGNRKYLPKTVNKPSKTGNKQLSGVPKGPKKTKRNDKSSKDTASKPDLSNMDVFSFSFEKPSQPGKPDEQANDENLPSAVSTVDPGFVTDEDRVLREDNTDVPGVESLQQLAEGIIILEPTEIENLGTGSDEVQQLSHNNIAQPESANLVTPTVLPVVIDQLLSNGDNMDLELIIAEKQFRGDESMLSQIQHGLKIMKNKTKKPKIASNFIEARRLMKVRKQIEREERKNREQALDLVKKLINHNGSASDNDQGIKLDIVCQSSTVPSLSPPIVETDPEEDLLYFPEAKEVFATNLKLLEYLQQEERLVTLDTETEIDSTIHVTASAPPYVSSSKTNASESSTTVGQQMESISFLDANRKATKRKHSNSSSSGDHKIFNDSAASMDLTVNDASKRPRVPNSRIGKARRVGLSKPKNHSQMPNSISTELSVVISEATPTTERASPSANNNNNGSIKGQRYSSDDLYKPRPANGLRNRSRTRAGEVQ
ncbi:biorientation of chromosomes in cell division protein 1-like 1 [Wyeomyia smithii]|uniref:biorientation of chromosomes in cell division protein 1-like 1 n=1 Tax=Wyeomyia smithii TaxID=174621 RepID=UPI0024680B0B|nr:biorientation of chromosomes in cell division protein 1-like 1 [Wyeomyia smithii]